MSEYMESAPDVEVAWENFGRLDFNRYLGNMIMIGIAPDGVNYQQVCVLVGRNDAERNRRFEIAEWKQGEFVQTRHEAEDGGGSKPYPTMLSYDDKSARRTLHIVTTGDRTRAILGAMLPDPKHGRLVRQPFGIGDMYDPDPADPHHTPRVSGLLDIGVGVKNVYGHRETHVNYGLRTQGGYSAVSEYPLHTHAVPGIALTAHSYHPEAGQPKPFAGRHYALPIFEDAETTRDFWWEQLPVDQRVAIAVVAIEGAKRTYVIRNA